MTYVMITFPLLSMQYYWSMSISTLPWKDRKLQKLVSHNWRKMMFTWILEGPFFLTRYIFIQSCESTKEKMCCYTLQTQEINLVGTMNMIKLCELFLLSLVIAFARACHILVSRSPPCLLVWVWLTDLPWVVRACKVIIEKPDRNNGKSLNI